MADQPLVLPWRFLSFATPLSSYGTPTLAVPTIGGCWSVDSIDVIASSEAGTPQCECAIFDQVGGQLFYDSQTIGEGMGVHFSWRGSSVGSTQFLEGAGYIVYQSSSEVSWAASASGRVWVIPAMVMPPLFG